MEVTVKFNDEDLHILGRLFRVGTAIGPKTADQTIAVATKIQTAAIEQDPATREAAEEARAHGAIVPGLEDEKEPLTEEEADAFDADAFIADTLGKEKK